MKFYSAGALVLAFFSLSSSLLAETAYRIRSITDLHNAVASSGDRYGLLYFHLLRDGKSDAMTPQVDKAAARMGATIYDVEIDFYRRSLDEQKLLEEFDVTTFPRVLIYRHDSTTGQLVGLATLRGYRDGLYSEILGYARESDAVRTVPVAQTPQRTFTQSSAPPSRVQRPVGSQSDSQTRSISQSPAQPQTRSAVQTAPRNYSTTPAQTPSSPGHGMAMNGHDETSDRQHREYDHIHGGPSEVTNGAPYSFSTFKSRAEALEDPYVISALNKCITCHIMYPYNDPKRDATGKNPGKLITFESLTDALVGEDGTFHRKRLKEIADGDARHIHFSARDLTAIKNLYLTEEKEVPEFERRLSADIVKADSWREFVKTLPRGKPRTREEAIRNPAVTFAAMRCVMCHTDPAVVESGAKVEGVNTLAKMRRVFRQLDKDTLHEMLKRGYETTQQYHIQDVSYVDVYADGTKREYSVPLRTALEELVRLPVAE